MKKALALILALVLCLGVLAGCQDNPAETKPAETKPAETKPAETKPAETQPTEPTEYVFPAGAVLDIYSVHSADMVTAPATGFIEKTLGIKLDWKVQPEGGLDVLMTEKVTPSLYWGYFGSGTHTAGHDGVLVNLWEHQDKLPDFFAHFNAEENAAYKAHYMTSATELYAAPVYLNGDVQRFGWLVREDIMKELNLEAPTDWDSFVAVLKAMKTAYPESYPFVMRNMTGNLTGLNELAQQFGVDYKANAPAMNYADNTYYDTYITDAMRDMLSKLNWLIDEGLMDKACMTYATAEWLNAFTSGTSFITHDKAFQLSSIEAAGVEANPNFSLTWWNNFPMVESDLPYSTRDNAVQSYCWTVTTKCADLDLALGYLNWLYTEEGSEIMSWGIEGESYEVDADGNKHYIEGFDSKFMARYQSSGYIDFTATMAAYSPKCQEMILDTMAAAKEGGFVAGPALTFNDDEQMVFDTYKQGWVDSKNAYLQKFIVGDLDVNDDAVWAQFIAESHNGFGVDQIIECYNNAHARLLAEG